MPQLSRETIPHALQLAQQCLAQGKLSEAEILYRNILHIEPQNPQATHGLGLVALRVGRPDAAVELMSKSVAMLQQDPVAHLDFGNALMALGRMNEAIESYRRALVLKPDLGGTWSNLGVALHESGQLEQSLECFQKAAELSPELPEPHNNAANALKLLGRYTDAIAAYRRALSIRPDSAETHSNLATILAESGQVQPAISTCREAIRLRPKFVTAHSNLLSFLQLDPDCVPETIHQEHRRWNELHAQPLANQSNPHNIDRCDTRRLRIGYVSPDLREHSVAYFIEGLLANHNRNEVETFCYADLQRKPDPTSARLQRLPDHWANITGLNDSQVAQMVRDDRIDILVDLAGHTAGNRLLAFARKPAPIQVTYLGYPNTTGLTAMDYRLTDGWADPPGMTERFHSEQLVRLPATFLCYSPSEAAPEVTPSPADVSDCVTLGSFNTLSKINPAVVAAWSQILRQCPSARMMIKANGLADGDLRSRLLESFARNGIDAERLELRARTPSAIEHLRLYGQIDLALDTSPYNGTTTTCEALWMGVPVVTLAGPTHIGRVGLSLLNNVGYPELAASSLKEYVHIAEQLINDRPRLRDYRARMRKRMYRSPLMDGPGFARHVEAEYRTMWQRWCAGRTNL